MWVRRSRRQCACAIPKPQCRECPTRCVRRPPHPAVRHADLAPQVLHVFFEGKKRFVVKPDAPIKELAKSTDQVQILLPGSAIATIPCASMVRRASDVASAAD